MQSVNSAQFLNVICLFIFPEFLATASAPAPAVDIVVFTNMYYLTVVSKACPKKRNLEFNFTICVASPATFKIVFNQDFLNLNS